MKLLRIIPALLLLWTTTPIFAAGPRPNIVWITSEDHGTQMGCYGDKFATTPNVDKLAARGVTYTRVWSCAPVCAPARTALISGLFPTSTGSEHMRSMVPYPKGKVMFPQLLREAGYYCVNNAKEDYNLKNPGKVWDASSQTAHWKNRIAGQPFFAVFNSEKSHESKLRVRPHKKVHDPAKVSLPAYHPDTPETREDWAQFYDTVTKADADAGARLRELEAARLTEDTIIFYFADHGSGMPRQKRWPYHSGLHVPLVVYIPEKFKALHPPVFPAGGKLDRLISLVDFAPTVLSLAGIKPPGYLHGHAFLGKFQSPPNEFLHGFRGRMDERNDLVRSVTDGRYVYIRNYMPHLIYGQHIAYMFQTPTTRVWKQLYDEDKLKAPQTYFWQKKPPEELYDLQSDPDEVHNLAASPQHVEIKQKLRTAQIKQARSMKDVGFIPEGEFLQQGIKDSPFDYGHDPQRYAFDEVFDIAETASMLDNDAIPRLKVALAHSNPLKRYWAALGFLMRGQGGFPAGHVELFAAMDDDSTSVRLVAAEAVAQYGTGPEAETALRLLVDHSNGAKNDAFVVMQALSSLDRLGAKAALVAPQIALLKEDALTPHSRYDSYVPRLVDTLKVRFK